MTTITASTIIGIELTPAAYTTPVVIAAGVSITFPDAPAVVYTPSASTTFFSIQNNGTISSTFGNGVYLTPGGAVTNQATGSITDRNYAIEISGGAGTVVEFASSRTDNLLELVPGYGLSGAVGGGTNTVIALELASAASAGTVTGLGSKFADLGPITFDVLFPVHRLLNGTSIVQMPCDTITYWHLELASHDAIIADGLPAETYLNTGNRADFANGGPAVSVHPTFADASAFAPIRPI